METWFLVLWLLWPDGTVEKGEYGPFPSIYDCVTRRADAFKEFAGATVIKAVCEEEGR